MNHKTAMRFISKDFANLKLFDDSIGGTDGVEGYYSLEGDSLYIFFNPTDHENDWKKILRFGKEVFLIGRLTDLSEFILDL